MNPRFSLRFGRLGLILVLVALCVGMSAAAQAQSVTVTPSSITFSPTVITTSSGTNNVTLTNTGTAALTISSISVGANYTQTNNCGTGLAAGGRCTIGVAFVPTASGVLTGTLSIADSATGSPQTVSLTGTGLPPVYFSAVNFSYGNQATGTTSAAKTVTVTNRKTVATTVSVAISGDYAISSNTCGTSIAASGTCTIGMTFTPTATGTRTGTLTVTAAGAPPATATLTGIGTAPYTLSPTSLAFGTQNVNVTSAAKTVTFTNTQAVAMSVSGAAVSAGFAQTNNCPASLAASASCTFSVTFRPTTATAYSGTLTFSVSNGAAPVVTLTGTGLLPLTVSPTSLAFGNQALNTPSPAKVITIQNTGTTALAGVSVVTAGTGFSQTNSCTASLAAGASCTDSIVFNPTTTGAKTGTVTVNYTGGTAQTVSLTGTGTAAVAISPTTLTFASQNTGTVSAAQTVTVTNSQNTAMSISSIAASVGFAQTNTCGTSLAAKASCTISVTFAPTVSGAQTGTITITDNAAGSPQTVALTGTGAAGVTVSPNALAFGVQMVNTTSPVKPITVTNVSGGRTTITVAATGNFAQTNTCTGRIRNNNSCTVSVTFTPTSAAALTGTLSVSAAGSTQVLALTGTGASVALGASPTSLAFGSLNTGTTSAAKVVTVTNAQGSAVAISGIAFSVASYSQTNTCGTSLAANSSCTVSVVFAPTVGGSFSGNMTITTGGGTLTVAVSGAGLAPVSVTPASVVFAPTVQGVAITSNITVKNNLTVNVGVTSITVTGAAYSQTNNCTTLTPGLSCTITATFTPTVVGGNSGSLTVNTDNAASPTTTVALSGTGLPAANLAPVSLAFGSGVVLSPSAAKTITLTNSQPFAMTVSTVLSGDFSQTNTCGTALAAKSSCTFNVVFTPTVTGNRTGSLAITAVPGGTFTASLTGTGIQPPITALPASVVFGPMANPNSTAPQPITVHNATGGAFTIASITPSTNFTAQNVNCPMSPATFAAGANCTVNVAFAPSAAVTSIGVQTGTLSIADNAIGSPQVVALSGTATPQMTGITVTPGGVTLGLNATQQFTAQATFASAPALDVTNTATWTVGSNGAGVVTVNPTGLATVVSTPTPNVAVGVIASLEGVSGAGFLSTSNTAPVTCTSPTIDMKLLVINNGPANYADFPAIKQILDYVGTPYEIVDASTGVLPALSDGACHGFYQGVIFAYGGDYYSFGGAAGNGLTYQQTLINYEISFGVRQLNWYGVPDGNYGLAATGTVIPSTQTYTTTFQPAAASIFYYANTNTPFTITNAAVNLATAAPASGGSLTVLLQDSQNQVSSAIYNYQGQQILTQLFDSNESLNHNLVVAYGLLNWVTKGIFLGDYHVYASAQVDDFFINDSEWIPSTTCLTSLATRDRTAPDASNLPVFRIDSRDMAQLVAWQNSVQNDPSGLFRPFALTMAFNGVGTVGNGEWTGMTASVTSAGASGGVGTFVAEAFAGQVGQTATIAGTSNGMDGIYLITSVTPSADSTPPETTFTVAFAGTIAAADQDNATVSVPDDLVANLASYQAAFHWISHTYNHPGTLNQLCQSVPGPSTNPDGSACGDFANGSSPTDSIDLELLTNRWIAGDPAALPGWAALDTDPNDAGMKQLIFTDFNPANIVTPGVSGLSDPNVPGYMYNDGIRYAVSDTSVIGQPNNGPNPSPNVGIVSTFNGVPTGIYEVPRYPNDIFYNAATWADDATEFQCIYQNYVTPNTTEAPHLVDPYGGYNASQVLDFTSGIFVQNMMKGDMNPQMFHQPDLHFANNYAALTASGPRLPALAGTPFAPVPIPGLTPTSVGSLISDTYNLTFSKYKSLYNLPVLSPTLDQTAQLMQARNAYNLSGVTASLTGPLGSQTISLTVPSGSAVIPVTGLNTQGSEVYGGQHISHITVTAGTTASYPAQ